MTEQEYEVLSKVLQDGLPKGARQLVIASRLKQEFSPAPQLLKFLGDSFSVSPLLRFLCPAVSPVEEGTVWDFCNKTDEKAFAEARFTLPIPYVVLDETEQKAIFEEGWRGFYNRYPDALGLSLLSRVGFNEPVLGSNAIGSRVMDLSSCFGKKLDVGGLRLPQQLGDLESESNAKFIFG
jgi:hypothetical protein